MQALIPKIFKDRLTTTDESGHRIRVIPAKVRGHYQNIKNFVHPIMLIIFLILPWLKIGNYPVLQLDVPHRRFFILGHLFLPQDVPGIFFAIAFFAVTLIFISVIWGRLWCGWACPQTVFIEGFFRRIERWIEGDHLAQRELDKAPWGVRKISKKTLKWFFFTLGALVITNSFLAYFVGANNVLHMMIRSPYANPGSFAVVFVSTAVILFDFGWFREQFCLVACPYGRFQSVMMDEESLTITYDTKRGEPRKGLVPKGEEGDCINCFKCVRVCPTGIDIRNGFQMECIACTACADECDQVMEKIGKPKGLVRYASEFELSGGKLRFFRPRVLLYGFVLVVLAGGLIYRVANQETYQTEVLRAIDTPFQVVMADNGQKQVINHFKINWYNLSPEDANVKLELPENLKSQGVKLIQTHQDEITIKSGQSFKYQFFIEFPIAMVNQELQIQSSWRMPNSSKVSLKGIKVVGPK